MSMQDSGKTPIPAAALVPPRSNKKDQPARRKTSRSYGDAPWVQIIAGGSAVWIIVIAVMALYTLAQTPPPPQGPVIPAGAVLQAEQPIVAPKVQPAVVAVKQEAAVPEEEPKAVAAVKKAAREEFEPNQFASCEQIGTNVLFMKNPPEAFKRAEAERKMVFMVHLSGNLEDKDFT